MILFLILLEMQPVTVFKVAKTITCHCWNKDRTRFELIELVNLVEIALALQGIQMIFLCMRQESRPSLKTGN